MASKKKTTNGGAKRKGEIDRLAAEQRRDRFYGTPGEDRRARHDLKRVPSGYAFLDGRLEKSEPETIALNVPTAEERRAAAFVLSRLLKLANWPYNPRDGKRRALLGGISKRAYWSDEDRHLVHAAYEALVGVRPGDEWKPALAAELRQELETREEIRQREIRSERPPTVRLRGVDFEAPPLEARAPAVILARLRKRVVVPSGITTKVINDGLDSCRLGGGGRKHAMTPEGWVKKLAAALSISSKP